MSQLGVSENAAPYEWRTYVWPSNAYGSVTIDMQTTDVDWYGVPNDFVKKESKPDPNWKDLI